MPGDKPFDHVWRWDCTIWRPIDRKGHRCRILVRAKMNSILVEFEDGFLVSTSRWAVRPYKETGQRSIFE